jgi:hypothetical protein
VGVLVDFQGFPDARPFDDAASGIGAPVVWTVSAMVMVVEIHKVRKVPGDATLMSVPR